MRSRLIIVILLFVIVPTVILSFMAARALQNWELVLRKRLELESVAAVQATAARIDGEIEQDLRQVIDAMAIVQARGGAEREMRQAALRLRDSRPLISRVYVFMNPWDFLFPLPDEHDQAGSEQMTLLLTSLRSAIASATSPNTTIRFKTGGSAYIFGLVSMQGLYAGYELDRDALLPLIKRAVSRASGGFTVYAVTPDLVVAPDGCRRAVDGRIVVTDPLDAKTSVDNLPVGPDTPTLNTAAVAESRLSAPFQEIKIRACMSNVGEVHRAGRLRARVYGWSIMLLALGVVAGTGYVLYIAVDEIRRARARSDFVIGVSHDLRTPLASMKMLTESLHMGTITDPDKRQHFLGTILRETERLSQLIERVLFFVRYGQRALLFKFDPTDIGQLVNSAVDAFVARTGDLAESDNTASQNYRTVGGKLRIRVVIEDNMPLVSVDSSAIMQVLLNLLDNAEKYGKVVPKARPPDHIDIDLHAGTVSKGRRGNPRCTACITVRDFGMGIEPRAIKQIFRPFYRSRRAGETNLSGVGLGLALCRHIVRAHGGRIEVKSEVGKGSTFAVFLRTCH